MVVKQSKTAKQCITQSLCTPLIGTVYHTVYIRPLTGTVYDTVYVRPLTGTVYHTSTGAGRKHHLHRVIILFPHVAQI